MQYGRQSFRNIGRVLKVKTENRNVRPVGRPPLDAGNVKVVTPIRLVAKEKAAYEKAAEKAGMSLSESIRFTLNKAVAR
jgi:hypothetical protein